MKRRTGISAARFGAGVAVGAAAALPGAIAAWRGPIGSAERATGLIAVAFALPVLAVLCHPREDLRREADVGLLLLAAQVLLLTTTIGTPIALGMALVSILPWLWIFPDRRSGRPSPRQALYERLRLVPAFVAIVAVAYLPAATSEAGGLLVGFLALATSVFLFGALRAPRALDEWREGFSRSGWALALLLVAGLIACGPVFMLRKRGADWLDQVVDGQVAWQQSNGCITLMIAAAAAVAALTLAFVAATRERGFAALNEEFLVLSTFATGALAVFDLAPLACVPVAIQGAVFLRWTLVGLAWPSLLLHLGPGLAIGYAALFARFFSPWPIAWLAYGAALGAAFAVEAVNTAFLRAFAGALMAGRRWQTAYGLCASLAEEGDDRDEMVRAGHCAHRLQWPATAAHWFERAGLWARAGSLYLESARARRPLRDPRTGARP